MSGKEHEWTSEPIEGARAEDRQDNEPTKGLRPEDARWWLAQWRRDQGIEAKVQEWLDGPFSKAVEKAAKSGLRRVRVIDVECNTPLREAIEDRLEADGWKPVIDYVGPDWKEGQKPVATFTVFWRAESSG